MKTIWNLLRKVHFSIYILIASLAVNIYSYRQYRAIVEEREINSRHIQWREDFFDERDIYLRGMEGARIVIDELADKLMSVPVAKGGMYIHGQILLDTVFCDVGAYRDFKAFEKHIKESPQYGGGYYDQTATPDFDCVEFALEAQKITSFGKERDVYVNANKAYMDKYWGEIKEFTERW